MSTLPLCEKCDVRSMSICSVLSERELGTLRALGQEVRFRARAAIFAEERPADVVYNITAGLARMYRLRNDGSRQIVGFGLPGDFLGMPVNECHGFSADAVEFTVACRIPRKGFSRFLDDNPHLVRRLHDLTILGLNQAHEHMMLLGRATARAKMAAFLIGLRDRWARIKPPSATVALPMGRQDIADFLGLSIATASRTLHHLADERLILIEPGGARILDLKRLKWLAGS